MKGELVVKAVVLVIVSTIVAYSIYPYLYSLFYPLTATESKAPEGFIIENTPTGRVFKYIGTVRLGKDPDDPFETNFFRIFPLNQAYDYNLGHSLAASGVTLGTASVATSAELDSTLDFIRNVYISADFTVTTSGTGTVRYRITDPYSTIYNIMFITRTFQTGYIYRWRITIPAYWSDSVRVSPLVPRRNTGFVYSFPHTTSCVYQSGGQFIESTSGLTLTISRSTSNSTHSRWSATIAFGGEWVGRLVLYCTIYTTHSSVISDLNNVANRQITSGRLYIAYIDFNPDITIASGDSVSVEVWYIAPSS